MHGQLSATTEVAAPASAVWNAYRGLELGNLVNKLLSDVIGTTECVEGDGGVGTVMKLTFPPGTPGVGYMKEKFTKMDDNNRVKETEIIEGGFKEMGFHMYRIRMEIIEKDAKSTVIRSTTEYEVADEHAENASFVTNKPMETIAEVIGKHLTEMNAIA